MKLLKLVLLGVLGAASICQAQVSTVKIENVLTSDRRDFVHSLSASYAIDDETTILRAHLIKTVLCRISSEAARAACDDILQSEDLTGQNISLLDFALSSKNLSLVLEALRAVYRGAASYALTNEAKEQLQSLTPITVMAIAQVGNPVEDAANLRKEIVTRSALMKAFSENVALRVYLPLLNDALLWLQGNDPEGRPKAWEIAGATIVEQNHFTCRVRKSGKFQCYKMDGVKRIDFPMENEDGFKLTVMPYNAASKAVQVCSENSELNKIHCWSGVGTPDGGYEIEKCDGQRMIPSQDSLFGSTMLFARQSHFFKLSCKSGERWLVYKIPLYANLGELPEAYSLFPTTSPDVSVVYPTSKELSVNFLNYNCRILKAINSVECRPIPGLPNSNLHLWIVDQKTNEVRDAGTQDLFFGFTKLLQPDAIVAMRDGVCVGQSKVGFQCRHFIIEGDKALALDYTGIEESGLAPTMDHYVLPTPGNPSNALTLEMWNWERKILDGKESYLRHALLFDFDGGLSKGRQIFFNAFFSFDHILCFKSSRRKLDGSIDYQDPELTSGATQRCVRLGEKAEILGDVETAIPFTQAADPQRIGRALCLTRAGQMVCDFPAIAQRLFEKPVLALNAATVFSDARNGYMCSAEADSAACYDMNGPAPTLKPIRYLYRGLSKELMLTRDISIRVGVAGNEPWMCVRSGINYAMYANNLIEVCESEGVDGKIYRLNATYDDTDDEVEKPVRTPPPAPTPRPPKAKRRSRSASMGDFFYPYRSPANSSVFVQKRSTKADGYFYATPAQARQFNQRMFGTTSGPVAAPQISDEEAARKAAIIRGDLPSFGQTGY